MNESRSIEDQLDDLQRESSWGRRFKGRVLSEVEDHLREGVRHEREGNVLSPEAKQQVSRSSNGSNLRGQSPGASPKI